MIPKHALLADNINNLGTLLFDQVLIEDNINNDHQLSLLILQIIMIDYQ